MRQSLKISLFLLVFFCGCKKDNDSNSYFVDNRDNKSYKIIEIGNQTWMAENLKYMGEDLILGDGNGSISNAETPLYYFMYNDSIKYSNEFGCLYTWTAAQNACPTGWHLPSDEEWKELEKTLGMTIEEVNKSITWRGTNQGTQLKENGSSGFNALMSGYRSNSGGYFLNQEGAGFWTSTENIANTAWHRTLNKSETKIHRGDAYKGDGFCVRCVKNK